jgi:hypothetical protein
VNIYSVIPDGPVVAPKESLPAMALIHRPGGGNCRYLSVSDEDDGNDGRGRAPKLGQSGRSSPLPSHWLPCCQPGAARKPLAPVQRDRRHRLAQLSKPTWVDHLYTCRYSYPTAAMTLSVKELSSWPQTLAYFHAVGVLLGTKRNLDGLGQGAFQTTNGSVVVRKDWKVLLVDVSHLPDTFGHPPTTASEIAVAVADVVLGCWAGD